jgi:FkbM family methyltransferase
MFVIVVLILLLIVLLFFLFNGDDINQEDPDSLKECLKIVNPLDNTLFLWENSDFTRRNWPDPYHDVEEKKFIFEKCKLNKPNHGIIDVGAHIGDLAIPLALALSNIGRSDIIVYAIDPSKEKCNFIKKMAKINSIKNIRILNYGLSDSEQIMGHDPIDLNSPITDRWFNYNFEEVNNITNTGSQRWKKNISSVHIDNDKKSTYDDESTIFVTADSLFLKKEIGPIGIYHIDVEGHEIELLNGSRKLIGEFKPLLFIESFINNAVSHDKCQTKEQCPNLFNLFNNISYHLSGFLPNGDLFLSPTIL